jgi:hypothetical protein
LTIKELDDALRKAAFENAIIAHVFMQHDRQFTTEALYQIAVGLHETNQRLHAIAADALNRSAAPIVIDTHSPSAADVQRLHNLAPNYLGDRDAELYQKLCGGQSDITIESANPDPWEARCAAAMPIVEAAVNLCHLAFDITRKQQVLVDQKRFQALQAAVGQYRIDAENECRANPT